MATKFRDEVVQLSVIAGLGFAGNLAHSNLELLRWHIKFWQPI